MAGPLQSPRPQRRRSLSRGSGLQALTLAKLAGHVPCPGRVVRISLDSLPRSGLWGPCDQVSGDQTLSQPDTSGQGGLGQGANSDAAGPS